MLDTLVNNLEGMVYRCLDDAQWTMIFASQGCTALTGYTPADIVNNAKLSWTSLTHPDDLAWVSAQIRQAIQEGRRFCLEYRIVTRSGELRWVVERGIAVPDEDGHTVIEGFIEDVTPRKVTLEALEHTELR